MNKSVRLFIGGSALLCVLSVGIYLGARGRAGAAVQSTGVVQPAAPLPPAATKLEGFKPSAGTLVTLGYDQLGGFWVSVDVREFRDSKGASVRGLVVEVRESQGDQRAFVDADEIPELLKGIDALLAVKANPTDFKNFERRYTTRGELELTVYNDESGQIRYGVGAGRTVKTRRTGLNMKQMTELRGFFEAASKKLATLSSGK